MRTTMAGVAIGLVAGALIAFGVGSAGGDDDSGARRQGALGSSVTASPPTGPAGGHLAGEYPEPRIALDAVGSGHIRTGAVTAGEIADGTVGALEIEEGAVHGGEISDVAVGSLELQGGAVNASRLGAVTLRESEWTEIPDSAGTHKVSASVSCASGEKLLSAGGRWRYPMFGNTFDRGQAVTQSTVTAYGSSDDTPNALRAWALCLTAVGVEGF